MNTPQHPRPKRTLIRYTVPILIGLFFLAWGLDQFFASVARYERATREEHRAALRAEQARETEEINRAKQAGHD
jgi:hypothetical protein